VRTQALHLGVGERLGRQACGVEQVIDTGVRASRDDGVDPAVDVQAATQELPRGGVVETVEVVQPGRRDLSPIVKPRCHL
jgi:hypothetical protein